MFAYKGWMHTTNHIPHPRHAAHSARLSKEAINELPLYAYEGAVTLVRTEEEMELAAKSLAEETVLGFDTETKPSFSKGKAHLPSLLQLAGEQGVYLFHMGVQPLSPAVWKLLETPDIVKVGVAVHDDLLALKKVFPFTPHAVYDLSTLAKKKGIQEQGLRGLAARVLGLRISKGERCSNWAKKDLSPRQIRYAATDAWISRAVFLGLSART